MRANDHPGALAERAWQLSGPQRTVLAGVLIAGALGYLRAYLANRSLWHDEALLALELIDRQSLLEPFHLHRDGALGLVNDIGGPGEGA